MNTLLHTDVYKMGHMEQYHPDIEYIQSHLIARKDDRYQQLVFFGLQYYLSKYLSQGICRNNINEFIGLKSQILGQPIHQHQLTEKKLYALHSLGCWPISIKSYPEGTICGMQDPLLVIENTVPGFHWVVGLIEGLMLKLWNTCTVATYSRKLKKIFTWYALKTGSSLDFVPFQVHDFGYRSVSSEETAALSGAAHLVNFCGTDTILAVDLINKYYGGGVSGLSVPASEHSVMSSIGIDNEIDAFHHMLDLYPTGIVSIVADTYDFYNVMNNFTDILRDKILAREGKVVFRPDSGDPITVSIETIQILDQKFGHTLTSTGHKLLNPKVGMIYGEGMYESRIIETLKRLDALGYASQNLVVGVGGLLLQQHNRDDMGFSFKANWAKKSDGSEIPLFKTPKTDLSKSSKGGYIHNPRFVTSYYEGLALKKPSLSDIRKIICASS